MLGRQRLLSVPLRAVERAANLAASDAVMSEAVYLGTHLQRLARVGHRNDPPDLSALAQKH